MDLTQLGVHYLPYGIQYTFKKKSMKKASKQKPKKRQKIILRKNAKHKFKK